MEAKSATMTPEAQLRDSASETERIELGLQVTNPPVILRRSTAAAIWKGLEASSTVHPLEARKHCQTLQILCFVCDSATSNLCMIGRLGRLPLPNVLARRPSVTRYAQPARTLGLPTRMPAARSLVCLFLFGLWIAFLLSRLSRRYFTLITYNLLLTYLHLQTTDFHFHR